MRSLSFAISFVLAGTVCLPVAADTIYGYNSYFGTLMSYDFETGASNDRITPLDHYIVPQRDISASDRPDELFMLEFYTGQLLTSVNYKTGVTTDFKLDLDRRFWRLSYDTVTDTLFGQDRESSINIYKIDTTTGASTLALAPERVWGPNSISLSYNDFDYDAQNDQFYLYSGVFQLTAEADGTISTDTQISGPNPFRPYSYHYSAVNPDTGQSIVYSSNQGTLRSVDGQYVNVGTQSWGFTTRGIAFANSGTPTPTAPVPLPTGAWFMLSGVGALALRRVTCLRARA